MKHIAYFSLFFVLFATNLKAQEINYSPAYFGPNANPVAEFPGAIIPEYTTLEVSGNYFFGFGDKAANPEVKGEIPLLPKRVSLKIWMALPEKFWVTQKIFEERQMGNKRIGHSNGGDVYVQTRISILLERKYLPAIVINATLKTASGEKFIDKRYFNTPGYYFDAEIGKSFRFKNKILNDIRIATDLGFFCWEMTGSRQNDALMYGAKIVFSNKILEWDNTIAGYKGRLKNGDNPLVFSTKLTGKINIVSVYFQYKYGIRDWHYHQLQLGVAVQIPKLTPKYKNFPKTPAPPAAPAGDEAINNVQ